MNSIEKLSVIIPITERYDDISEVYSAYKNACEKCQFPFEFIYVIDGDFPDAVTSLKTLRDNGEKITIIKLAKCFGEATALTVGFDHSTGDAILTLPAYLQIEPNEIVKIIDAYTEHDMVIANRNRKSDSFINRLQSSTFHLPIKFLTDLDFHDLGCGVRLMKRSILEEISIYGDQHRFLPLLAYRQGFRVHELLVGQAPQDQKLRIYAIGIYIRRLLDILSAFFLFKFTKKPLRFFGLFGSTVFSAGMLLLVYLVIDRVFFDAPLGDRPLLLLSSLFVVLGIQVFAIGLIGEIIIFTHARDIKEYTIEEIIN